MNFCVCVFDTSAKRFQRERELELERARES